MVGGGVSWSLGGVIFDTADSSGLGGWGGWNASIGAGLLGGQIGMTGDGGQTSAGPNVGWKLGGAVMRCFTYAVKCEGCEPQ